MGHKLFPGKIIFFFICSRVSLSPAPEPPPTGCCCFPGYTGRAGACEPHLLPHFWSLGEVGGREPPGRVPPSPGLCLHARLPAVYSPVPFLGVAQRGPPGYQVGTGGLEQPGGTQWGGHKWPFSLSGFSKGYPPCRAQCLRLLCDTNSCHWWVVAGGNALWGDTPAPGPLLPHPGGLIVPNSPPPPRRLPSLVLAGAAVTLSLSLCGSGAQPLSFWGSGAILDPPTPGSLAVHVWLGGAVLPRLCRCWPGL